MGRGSTKFLIRRIMECLAKGPRSATEISKETGLDRIAISRYLDVLRESNFIVEDAKGLSKKFVLSSNYRLDTYFGLPLDEEVNANIDSLYFMIKKKWEEIAKRKLLKTTAQKIIYQVINDCKLKLPVGWYIYGGVCVKPFDYDTAYKFQGLDEQVIACINKAVEEHEKIHYAYGHKQNQYQKAGKELYNVKEDILKLLYSKNFSKNSMYTFQKKFRTLWRIIPKGDSLYDDLINDYDTLLIDVTKHWDEFVNENNERDFAEFKQLLIKSFEAFWKLVATYNFKQDLHKFYLSKELDEHFKLDISQAKEELIEIGSELNELIPFDEADEQVNEAFEKLKKNASEEELKKQNNDLDKLLKEKGLEEHNKELLKKFSL